MFLLRRKHTQDKQQATAGSSMHVSTSPQTPPCRSLQKQISRDPGGGGGPGGPGGPSVATTNVASITLDSIITEYLTNQHALCKNPMVTCPQFNLLEWVHDDTNDNELETRELFYLI